MIVWLALSSGTAPRDWRGEDDYTLATAMEYLMRRRED